MPLIPSRRLAGLIAIAAAAFLVSTTLGLVVDLLLLALIVIEGIALYRLTPPELDRSAPARIPLGAEADVDVELRERSGRSRQVAWTDDADLGLARVGPEILHAELPARAAVVQSYPLVGSDRGRHRLGDIHLRVLGPAGLLWRRHRIHHSDEVVVQPGLQELRRKRLLALHNRRELGNRRVREVGEGREFERLREYTRGDDPRRIDWKATARRGNPIVREYEAERSQSIVLAVDAGRLMAERFGNRDRLDYALAAALVLADAATVHGDSVGVMIFADTVQTFLPPARMPLSRIADALTRVEPRRVEPDYPGAFRHLGRQLRRRSLVVLFTDVIDNRSSAALLAHLSASARRHLPLMIAIRNVELETVARDPVASEAEAYRRAAAEELLQARAVALASVRRQGVLVADVRPDEAVNETVSRYLEVKRKSRL